MNTLRLMMTVVMAPLVLMTAPSPHYAPLPRPVPPADSTQLDTVTLDLDRAIPIGIEAAHDLVPAAFTATDRRGWAVRIPGGRPIATPAYADGMIFVGGGYGSYEFYAFDAITGELVWKIKTADDGPTAAVVEDGYVAFNTESCTVIVVDAKTGRIVWQEWLGDPLMNQPAIGGGRLFMAHPAADPRRRDGQAQNHIGDHTTDGATSHRMLCADLATGRHIWSYPITADVITAPVVDRVPGSGDRLFFTCFDGTSYCLDAATGELVWRRENAGTSAPTVLDGHVVLTVKEMRDGKAFEGLKRVDRAGGAEDGSALMAAGEASYLDAGKGGGVALHEGQIKVLDGAVGFSTPPAAAELGRANSHVGVNSVVGGWAYQGSRAAHRGGRIMNAQGRYLNSVGLGDGRTAWRAQAMGKGVVDGSQVFAPPALGAEHMYLCTSRGELVAVRQRDGASVFAYSTGHPMAFQPALAQGRMYAGTTDGWLICLDTGSDDADGWYAWGGNAQHNKKE